LPSTPGSQHAFAQALIALSLHRGAGRLPRLVSSRAIYPPSKHEILLTPTFEPLRLGRGALPCFLRFVAPCSAEHQSQSPPFLITSLRCPFVCHESFTFISPSTWSFDHLIFSLPSASSSPASMHHHRLEGPREEPLPVQRDPDYHLAHHPVAFQNVRSDQISVKVSSPTRNVESNSRQHP
jgi:hypothetical protein